MLNALSEKDIQKIIDDKKQYDAVVAVEESSQKIVGFTFTNLLKRTPQENIFFDKGFSDFSEVMNHFFCEKTALYMDILVTLNHRGDGVARLLMYEKILRLQKKGFDSVFFEIYTINSIKNGIKKTPHIHNVPSERFHSFCGAQEIGHRKKKLKIQEYTCSITVDIYFLRFQTALSALSGFFSKFSL